MNGSMLISMRSLITMELLTTNLTRSVVCVVCSWRQNVCWSGIATLFDPELWHCLFHADIILLAPKVSFIQGNPMSIILLHMLPALLDLLMLETKKSRYIYTRQVNFLKKNKICLFHFYTTFVLYCKWYTTLSSHKSATLTSHFFVVMNL